MFACASNIFLASIPYLDPLVPSKKGEHTSRGSFHSRLTSFIKLVGITFLILQKGGEVNINSLNTCLKKLIFRLDEFRFCNHQKREIVDD